MTFPCFLPTTSMRVRLRSIGPLPTVKAWYEVSIGMLEQRTIAELKGELCENLFNTQAATHKSPLNPANLIIELEEFELLDTSSLNMIRENDLLVVKYKPVCTAGVKRRREENEEETTAVTRKAKKHSISSSSSSPSSSSCSSSSSDSTSSSSSDSDSDADDSSTETLLSTILSSKATKATTNSKHPTRSKDQLFPIYPGIVNNRSKASKQQQNSSKPAKNISPTQRTFVPPGEGKPATQQRNQRRRKRRMAEKFELQKGVALGMPERDAVSTFVDPTATPASRLKAIIQPARSTENVVDANASLAASMARATKNDNKRRGFKAKADVAISPSTAGPVPSSSSPFKSATLRLVPPSERTDLPRNIIVTSVDVEAGEWKLPTSRKDWGIILAETDADRQIRSEWKNSWDGEEASGMFLATQRDAPMQSSGGDNSQLDWGWDEIERRWEGYPALETCAVKAGTVLVWKELALHPVSFTPEVMVHAATVQSAGKEYVTLKMIPRVEPEADEEVEEEKMLNRKLVELVGYRVYAQ